MKKNRAKGFAPFARFVVAEKAYWPFQSPAIGVAFGKP
jgi:hypothetical protein